MFFVVAAECKRRRGTYLDNTCVPKVGGDAFRPTQLDWAAGALRAGVPREALLSIWWDRIEGAPCA